MQFVSIKRSLFLSLFLMGSVLYAQKNPIGSETVTVVKPYSPTVRDAAKIKETPVREDSVSLKKEAVQYSIFSVPVASTFTPAKGRATAVEKERPVKVYDNYASLGFGNYGNILAEFYSSLEVNRTDNFGIFLNHNSSQGGIDGIRLDDKFYDTELNLNYNSKTRDLNWNTEVGLQHQLYNWYGLPESPVLTNETILGIDPQQNYFSAYASGEVQLYQSFFQKAKAKFRYTGDSFSTSERLFNADANFEFNIADEIISTKLIADIVNGSFDRKYYYEDDTFYSFLNFGINPSLLILRDDLTIHLGLSAYYSLDTENSDNNFYIYPKITASLGVFKDYFTAYAGLEGGLEQNSYYNFVQNNPYISPNVRIHPTDNRYTIYVGGKGKLTSSINYNLKAGYNNEAYKPLFLRNSYSSNLNPEGYAYGNSFGVVYDDVKTLNLSGAINVDVNRNFRLGLQADYYSYSVEDQREAWNLPNLKASLNADYQISKKWYAGANLFYVGERKDYSSIVANFPLPTDQSEGNIITLDSYFDANAHVGYRINEQLSIFAKGSNLFNNNYQKWTNFEVQGLQLLGGATYKFDY